MAGILEGHTELIDSLRAERAEKWAALQLAGGRGVDLANAIDELDETIGRVEAGKPCCRECGSERIVAWYPEYARQGVNVWREDDGTIGYDYTGENTDTSDEAGADEEYWCLECETASPDLDYLVGAKATEDTGAYGWTGWHDGASDCEPPEPGKEWLSIGRLGEDGFVETELAIIVHRQTDHPDAETWRAGKVQDAQRIVDALNAKGR